MRKHIVARTSVALGAVLTVGSLVSTNYTTPQHTAPSSEYKTVGYELPGNPGSTVGKTATRVQPRTLKTSNIRGIWAPAGSHKPGNHGQFFGLVKDGNGRWVLCTMPYLPFRTGKIVLTKAALKAQRAGGSVLVKTAINEYINSATTASKAASLGFVAYSQTTDKRYQADVPFYSRVLGKTVVGRAHSELAWAKAHHGPWSASNIVWSKDKVAPGETNTGHLTLKSTTGHALKGFKPEVSCSSNTYIESVSLTNASGVATVKVHSLDNNAPHTCSYTIGHLPSGTRSLTASPSGFQQLTTGPVYEKVHNNGKFGNEHAKGTFNNNCGNTCGTTVPITGKVTAPCGGWNVHAVAKVTETGNTVEDINVQACNTKDVSFTVPNGDTKHLQWTFTFYHGDSHTTPQTSKPFKINCPPAPTVVQSSTTNCSGCSAFDLNAQKPTSDRSYTYVVKVNGSKVTGGVLSASTPISIGSPHGGDTVEVLVSAAGVTWDFSYVVPTVTKTS